MVFQGSLKSVIRNFLGCFNEVSMVFQDSLKGVLSLKKVLRIFQRSFKGVYRKFKGCFKEVLRVFLGSFREFSRVLQESFKGVSSSFKWVSRVFERRCVREVSMVFQRSLQEVSKEILVVI